MKSIIIASCYMLFIVLVTPIVSTSCKQCPSSPSKTDCEFVFIPHDTPPRVKDPVLPEYPEETRQLGIEGTVVLHLFTNEEVYVTDACVAQSVHPLLDKAAEKPTFCPALKDGEPNF